jgi:predicted AAA+ superfamily ATPase
MDNEICIHRQIYIDILRKFEGKPVIKIVTGMRRSGKSMLLRMLREVLASEGVPDNRMLFLNFESQSTSELTEPGNLYAHISNFAHAAESAAKTGAERRFYLILDEIQYVAGWERIIASCRIDFDCDIYITGSNAKLLAGELHTLLAGRFVSIQVYPLSFKEHLLFTKTLGEDEGKTSQEQFLDYLKYGGLPGIHEMNINSDAVEPYLIDIFNSVLLKDVITRRRIRDAELLERVVSFVFDNIGNIFSAKSISDFLKKEGRKLGTETIYNYLDALEESFFIRKAKRYDIKGKRLLETMEKYFVTDHGLKHAMFGYRDADVSGLLENIVYLELLRRGYDVNVGQLYKKEVDFVAEKRDEKLYIQVSYILANADIIEREFSPLEKIRDNYPKMVLSMDTIWNSNRGGIERRNIVDWLMEE